MNIAILIGWLLGIIAGACISYSQADSAGGVVCGVAVLCCIILALMLAFPFVSGVWL